MTHLLDTSALLTHYLDESGAEELDQLFAGGPSRIAVSVITWVELERRLAELVDDVKERNRVFHLYTEVLTSAVPVSADVAREAIRVRAACPSRIPMVDCLIAASAVSLGLVLVHRDKHMDGISSKNLKVTRLPEK
ncbi:MAG: type II toxin-antitoxin system VapC family toxin [Luteolibacter sp.]|uniref:type II toxin-antitoxin system VapC family toxin n=1 Tax=Luteolibacter sp. TaxID=1962973 RepID=UPI003264222E